MQPLTAMRKIPLPSAVSGRAAARTGPVIRGCQWRSKLKARMIPSHPRAARSGCCDIGPTGFRVKPTEEVECGAANFASTRRFALNQGLGRKPGSAFYPCHPARIACMGVQRPRRPLGAKYHIGVHRTVSKCRRPSASQSCCFQMLVEQRQATPAPCQRCGLVQNRRPNFF